MTERNSAQSDFPDQNSANLIVEHQVRPDDLMAELGIKKDAYYTYLKHLDIKAQKDGSGKAYLEPQQADRIRALRLHVVATGKIDGFEETALATSAESGLGDTPPWNNDIPQDTPDLERLIRQAQELAAHNMAMGDLVVAQLAQQMTFDDLAPDLQGKVTEVREATRPKANPAAIASQILGQWRSQRGATAA
ncbi:hypothetical protein H6F75_26395 [Nodosilinea sp. FACHB-131]|uniref:hypothetical protein n=1 Tax=Cyanophyceae TaxID=3028117 RepID=UPI00168397E0|nr:hypothetical protein [Nodosilinea sp. FACHB-131]MBD1877020.1 hypothetical protein [Nodosilinea sp. FACHB-131]